MLELKKLQIYMKHLKTPGIILFRKNINEADKLIFLYTKSQGKIMALARGLRKQQAKLAPHLEIFNLSNIMINRRTITSAQTINPFDNLRHNLETLERAYYILHLVNEFTPDQDKDEEIFLILRQSLKNLNNANNALDTENSVKQFEQKFIHLLGVAPQAHPTNTRQYLQNTLN